MISNEETLETAGISHQNITRVTPTKEFDKIFKEKFDEFFNEEETEIKKDKVT